MSIALYDAITGLTNFQRQLDVVGNNIANMSTPGYKESSISFKEMLSQTLQSASGPSGNTGGTNPIQIGLGSSIGGINANLTQGLLESTGRGTDLAIVGNGYLIVDTVNGTGYTRNGSCSTDVNGNLVDSSGNKVQGWLATNGSVDVSGPLENVVIPIGESSVAQATSNAVYSGNLDASQDVYSAGPPASGGIYTSESIVYDSLGNSHRLALTFQRATPADGSGITSQWNWTATLDGNAAGSGLCAYDSNGAYDTAHSTADPTASYAIGGGAADMSIHMDFSQTTQLSSPGQYSISLKSQDGFETGTLQSFAIDGSGTIIGSYSNGMSQTIGQLALADFMNPEGLQKTDGGVLRETANSGPPQIGTPATGSRGSITAGYIENSNVDLSTEFTKMIIAQRAFQANSRVVTVMDQVLEEMANLGR